MEWCGYCGAEVSQYGLCCNCGNEIPEPELTNEK